jgi:hypothetical protein
MTQQLPYNNPSTSIQQQPPLLGWLAILGLVAFTAICIAGGLASIFRPAYVVLSFLIGIFLYARYPMLYMGFVWWMWFITPFLSRLIDYRSAFDETRFIFVSQYLVTLITLHSSFKNLPKSHAQGGLPFMLTFMGVFYGFLIGLIKTSPFTAARGLLDWLTPISFGFYLFIKWREYPQYQKNIQRVFLWGVLITGTYAIIQYLVAPEWDKMWLIKTKLLSMGQPAPLKLRVWSTMASPGPFSVMMMTGLLLLFEGKGPLSFPAAAVGYLSFLLTMVRTMWGSWFVGLLVLVTSLKLKLQMRLVITMIVMVICVLPLTTMEPFSKTINDRLQTFTNLEHDDSAIVRQQIYEEGLQSALTNSLGNGIGNTFIVNQKGILEPIVIDSGILDSFFTLGWFGAVMYLGGMILLIFKILQCPEFRFDSFMAACRAIALGCVLAMPGFSIMLGFSGMFLWGFLGLTFAGHKYHQHQRAIGLNQR